MSERAARVTVLAVAALLALGGLSLLAVRTVDPAALAPVAARQAPDGSVSGAFVRGVRHRSAICGGLALACVAGVVAARGTLLDALRGFRRPAIPHLPATAIAIILFGTAARISILDLPLHWDEAFTFNEYVARSPLDFLSRYSHPNNHVLHTLLAWIVRATAGESRWLLRLPAFAAGVALLPATWSLARRLGGPNAALVALALAAGASPLVEYSAQGRGYTMVALATLSLFSVPLRWNASWLVAALVAALGAWTVPVMFFPFAAYVAFLLLHRVPVRRVLLTVAATGVAAFVLYLPVLVVSGPRSVIANGNVVPLGLAEVMRTLPSSLVALWIGWMRGLPAVAALLLVAASLMAPARFALRRAGSDREAALLAASLVAGVGPLLILLRVVPFARVWLFLLPLVLVLAACGLTRETWPRATVAVPALAIAAALCWLAVRSTQRRDFFEDPAMRDAPAVAAFVRAHLPPRGALLAVQPFDAPYAFELRGCEVVQSRFDSERPRVQAAVAAHEPVWAVVGASGMQELRGLGFTPGRRVARIGASTLVEVQ